MTQLALLQHAWLQLDWLRHANTAVLPGQETVLHTETVTPMCCVVCNLQGDEVGADCSILGSLDDPSSQGSKQHTIKQRFQVGVLCEAWHTNLVPLPPATKHAVDGCKGAAPVGLLESQLPHLVAYQRVGAAMQLSVLSSSWCGVRHQHLSWYQAS